MKLLNRDEFLKLPVGTIYTNYDRGSHSGEIFVKQDNLTRKPLINNFGITSEDGLLFAVFEAKELSEMTKLIQVGLRLAITSEQTNAPT